MLSQWDDSRFDILSNRIKKIENYLNKETSYNSFYLFNFKNITYKEKNFLDLLSSLDIFFESSSYKTQDLKYHYVLRKALLRLILSKYVKIPPLNISFKTNLYGKPYFENCSSKIYFNFSHTKDYGFLGVSKNNDIGADIEVVKPLENKSCLLDIFSYPEEKEWVLKSENSSERFFILWTAKEALVKAIGTGFLADSIPKITVKHTKENFYELFYKNYIIFSKSNKCLKHVTSICYEK